MVKATASNPRAAATQNRAEIPYDFLFKLFAKRDEGGRPNYGKTIIPGVLEIFPHTGLIAADNFQKVLYRKLQIRPAVTRDEVAALFEWYGHDKDMLLPYDLFARRLCGGEAKANSKQGCKTGAFRSDEPDSWTWDGMVRYPPCNTGVFPHTQVDCGSDWSAIAKTICKESRKNLDSYLKLEYVFGYGVSFSSNLFYNSDGNVVYFAAGLGVVLDVDNNKQKFFLRHDDDIECLSMHPDGDTVASAQYGVKPSVWIWSSKTRNGPRVPGVPVTDDPPPPIKLVLPRGERSVIACGFSGDEHACIKSDCSLLTVLSACRRGWRHASNCVYRSAAHCQGVGVAQKGSLHDVCCNWYRRKGRVSSVPRRQGASGCSDGRYAGQCIPRHPAGSVRRCLESRQGGCINGRGGPEHPFR